MVLPNQKFGLSYQSLKHRHFPILEFSFKSQVPKRLHLVSPHYVVLLSLFGKMFSTPSEIHLSIIFPHKQYVPKKLLSFRLR
uniref:Putative ovule protein n=1 Tax=Solanum chacoense TaxID=4108 RepID=A0A0V0GUC3_SOLCH